MDSAEQRSWLWERLGETCVENLKKHRFDAYWVPSREDALKLIYGQVAQYNTFGFGGSDSTRSIGIIEKLKSEGKVIFDHNVKGLPVEEAMKIRLEQGRADVFFTSANAVSLTGEIVNVDGAGNRTSAMSFGPKKVVIVAGMNKVVSTLEDAVKRVRDVAAPMRAHSLNMDTPCAKTGICADCNSPMRICNITTILHRKPMFTDVSVVLINEDMGY